MRKENLHQLVEVIYKRADQCPLVNSQLSFFQMVYVISGSGLLHINGNAISYQTGNLMLLTPNDCYSFDIVNTTEFLLVKLNSEYAKEYKSKSIDHVECLFHYASHLSGCILSRKADEYLVKSIAESLLHTMDNKDIYDEDLIIHYVNALIVIAARNIAKIKPSGVKESADKRVLEIINYIQTNIFYPQKLKVLVMAKKFDISDTYLGSYFKNHSGETIQSFVSNYKIRLIEHRLSFSDMRINEIVDEFGFSDESHLNKFFKKHRNVSLTAYRKAKVSVN
ncbi:MULTISPECIES: AraC family transcriptional regulator [Flavobacterium]|uniref:AraC family transcriptional regulator n=1 Tax=Flavobacterium lipolyticum TaxID=2893754 RepID=A0ABS8M1V6_9FLAO|nr:MULTISPECIES: AraC family transcriptional regulator [unclassified Flavobacterium]MCC9018186.1 AraC family transcriptional regulator [Flavobacterium sp. F-126]